MGTRLDLGGFDQEIGSLDGGGATGGSVSLGGNFLTLGGDGFDTMYSGVISGTGGLTKLGAGVFILSGYNTYSGLTRVQGGTLSVMGVIGGSVDVYNGAVLKGSGSIGGDVSVFSGGTLTGGASIGTLTILGDLVLNPGSVTTVEVSDSASSLIAVTGVADLDGRLQITLDLGSYTNRSYTILTAAGGLSGTFAEGVAIAGSLPPGLSASVLYHSNLIPPFVEFLITDSGAKPRFQANLFSGNALKLGIYLDGFIYNPRYSAFLDTLFSLPQPEQLAALSSLNPDRASLSGQMTSNTIFGCISQIGSRLSIQRSMHIVRKFGGEPQLLLPCERSCGSRSSSSSGKRLGSYCKTSEPAVSAFSDKPRSKRKGAFKKAADCLEEGKIHEAASCEKQSIWWEAIGDFGYQNRQNQMPKFTFASGGGLIGYDFMGSERGMLGCAGGYIGTSMKFAQHQGKAFIDTYVFGPYMTAYMEQGYVELGVLGSLSRSNNKRHVIFPTFDAEAKSSRLGFQATPRLGFGYDFVSHRTLGVIECFAALDYCMDWERSYCESGAEPFNMETHRQRFSVLRSEVGIRYDQHLNAAWGVCILKESISYVNQQPFSTKHFTASLVGEPLDFSFTSFSRSSQMLLAGLQVFLRMHNGFFGSLEYDGEFLSGYLSNRAQAMIGLYF